MLNVNLPLMKQNLNKLLDTPPINKGPIYNAAYNAYYEVNTYEIEGNNDDPDLAPIIAKNKIECEQKMKDNANKFATEFCNSLKSGGFMDTIADEIDGHVKAVKLLITMMPQGITTIVSPVGPCSGSMIIDDTTANIQIL